MADPTNYIVGQPNPTPFASLQQGYALGQGIRQDQQAQQIQGIQIQQMQALMAARAQVANNPNATANDYSRLMALDPATAEATQKAWTTKNTAQQQTQASNLLQWGAAITNGQPQVAADQMTAQADAMDASNGGQPTPDSQALRAHAQIVVAHPQFALGQVQAMLGSNPNGKQAADTLSALADVAKKKGTLPADIRTADADATIKAADAGVATQKAAADINKTIADTNLTNTTAGLDTAKFQRLPGAVDLPASALDIINKSGDESSAATASAAQMTDLANQIDTAAPNSLAGGTAEALKSFTGQQNYITSLRQEYVRLRASEVMKSLPPGSASDTDVKQALLGFPSETASPATLSSFLRGVAKLQTYQAQYADAKSQWVNQVGSLGMSNRDINVNGTTVPANTPFSSFVKARLKPIGAQTQPTAPAAGTAASLIAKYGGGTPAPVAPSTGPLVPGMTPADTAGTD